MTVAATGAPLRALELDVALDERVGRPDTPTPDGVVVPEARLASMQVLDVDMMARRLVVPVVGVSAVVDAGEDVGEARKRLVRLVRVAQQLGGGGVRLMATVGARWRSRPYASDAIAALCDPLVQLARAFDVVVTMDGEKPWQQTLCAAVASRADGITVVAAGSSAGPWADPRVRRPGADSAAEWEVRRQSAELAKGEAVPAPSSVDRGHTPERPSGGQYGER